MVGNAAPYCTKCGSAFPEPARFCPKCGAPRTGPIAATPNVAQQTAATTPSPAAPAPASVAGTMRQVQTAVSTVGTLAALPWQTVVGTQSPDLGAFLRQAGAPVAQTIVRRSVRKPALALMFTTFIDIVVAFISGQPAALSLMLPRLLTGTGTGLLGLLVGKKQGPFRKLVGIGSIFTTGMQLFTAGAMLIAAVSGNAPFLTLLPSLISTTSVVVVAIKTLRMTLLKRRSK